ncbi:MULTISPECIES: TetR/AcrR family transcriptional regulator [Actinosynnema]|uniref:TetR/AcrR family transcriptional regulator n=1 Tax=Actinosynnema TaxID=40566 RepID=UPI0020A4662A|nr:TetR family transcriptional regulator [Actinosynnema pretiosum]MCP2097581.1 transcriptional regulator, TetR family [Actinosynnema pretiosum]
MSTAPARKHVSASVRRELLVAAALRVMKRDGVAAATTRAICAEADMPHGAFHYCFRSKRELFTALLSTGINTSLDAAWPAISPDLPAVDNIRTLLDAFWTAFQADPEAELVLGELVALAQREPELRELPAWQHREYTAKAAAHLERLARESGVEYAVDGALLAEMVVSVLDGVASSWFSHRDDELARAALEQFALMFAALTR